MQEALTGDHTEDRIGIITEDQEDHVSEEAHQFGIDLDLMALVADFAQK
jgi:hypothetical protein